MDMGAGQPDAGVVDDQHRSNVPTQAGRAPDRIGSLCDDACPGSGAGGSDSQNAARAFPDVVGYIVGWSVLAPV